MQTIPQKITLNKEQSELFGVLVDRNAAEIALSNFRGFLESLVKLKPSTSLKDVSVINIAQYGGRVIQCIDNTKPSALKYWQLHIDYIDLKTHAINAVVVCSKDPFNENSDDMTILGNAYQFAFSAPVAEAAAPAPAPASAPAPAPAAGEPAAVVVAVAVAVADTDTAAPASAPAPAAGEPAAAAVTDTAVTDTAVTDTAAVAAVAAVAAGAAGAGEQSAPASPPVSAISSQDYKAKIRSLVRSELETVTHDPCETIVPGVVEHPTPTCASRLLSMMQSLGNAISAAFGLLSQCFVGSVSDRNQTSRNATPVRQSSPDARKEPHLTFRGSSFL